MKIPISEIRHVKKDILSKPQYLNTEFVISEYEKHVNKVITSNSSREICNLIIDAISHKTPYSVIRIGDGEINVLTAYVYSETPVLDFYVAKEAIEFCEHTFVTSEKWLLELKKLTYEAVVNADVIGVLGLERFNTPTVDQMVAYFEGHIRGISGQHRGIDYMLTLARNKLFLNKTISYAHLYFSIIEHLHEIISVAKKLILITNKQNVYKKLCENYPKLNIQLIDVEPTKNRKGLTEPLFFHDVLNALDKELSGTLSLVGAGIWSEHYCNEIKKRNGVAVDIGSGFDLLDSRLLRPLHKKMGYERLKKYFL